MIAVIYVYLGLVPPFTNNITSLSNNITSLSTTLSGLSMSSSTFDPQRKGNFIKLTDNGHTATATAENQTIATTTWLTTGVHSVAFRINYEHQYICKSS